MRYYFNTIDVRKDVQYDQASVRSIRLFPAEQAVAALMRNPETTLWPVYDAKGGRSACVECNDEAEAYDYLLEAIQIDPQFTT